MRDRDTIDDELRLLAAVRRAIRGQGGEPSSRQVGELLGSRFATAPGVVDGEVTDYRRERWRDAMRG